ncbi:long-chain-fatty-acid--CoA ligase [Lysinibacillus sp. PLM2]|nr:long-chain-fatty-acid--CoA ligase [Lysinibacillus sp. PLM2]
MSLYDILASLDKNGPSLTTVDNSYTAGDLRNVVTRYELLFHPYTLEGKRVALLVPNIKEFLPLLITINKLKGTISPLSLQSRQDDLLAVLDFLDPHIVVTVNEYSGFNFSEVVTNWAKDRKSETTIFSTDNYINWSIHTFHGSSKKLQNELGGFICFTSGSTGNPKGVVIKDTVIDYGYERLIEAMELKPDDNVFVYASISGVYGIIAMKTILRLGATLVVSDDFNLVEMINAMKKANCNKLTTTPSIFKTLYNFASRIEPEVLKSLELVSVIGEKIPANFKSHFPLLENCKFLSNYGSSESGPLANAIIKEDNNELEFTMSDAVNFKIVDGELLVKTGGLFSEYYNNATQTEEVFENGWFKMGDLVEFSDDKTFKLVGRKKEVIKKGGQQVIPSEVEQILSNIEGIETVAVVGAPHEVYGEQVIAFIIAKGVNSKDIRSYCTGRIASFKIPDKIVFVDEFPLKNGKVDKLKLKSQLGRG